MSPLQAVAVAFGGVFLLILWRLVDGWLGVQRRRVKAENATRALEEKVAKLAMELTRFPMDVPDVRDLEALEANLSAFKADQHRAGLELAASLSSLRDKLITREMAEKIVNQMNQVTLDVVALKEWQSTLESSGELAQTLGLEAPKEN